jgi:hypothetical protein
LPASPAIDIAAELAFPALARSLKQSPPLRHLQGTALSNRTTFRALLDQYCRVSSPSHPLDISHLNFLGLGHQQIRFTSFGQQPHPQGRFANRSPSVCSPSPATQVVRDSLHQFEFDMPRRRELELAQICCGEARHGGQVVYSGELVWRWAWRIRRWPGIRDPIRTARVCALMSERYNRRRSAQGRGRPAKTSTKRSCTTTWRVSGGGGNRKQTPTGCHVQVIPRKPPQEKSQPPSPTPPMDMGR